MWKTLRDRSAWLLRHRPYFKKKVTTHCISNMELVPLYKTGVIFVIWSVISFRKLHGYTVHQQYPTIYCPTDAHNVKK